MKKIAILILTLFNISMYSQVEKYPRIEKDSLGQEIVVMTIKQAMILDNNSDLLKLYEQLGVDVNNYDNSCIKVIDGQNKVISTLNLNLNNLKDQILIKDEKIKTLQSKVTDYIMKVSILDKQALLNDSILNEKNKQLRSLKTKMVIGGVGTGAIIVGLVVLLISR